MKNATWGLALGAMVLCSLPVRAQQQPPKDPAPQDDDDQMTPEQAMEMLQEVRGLMGKAEELLNDSSRGKALETEEELIEKLKREFNDEPAAMQKQILEKIQKLTERAAKREKSVIDKLAEVIKKVKS